MGASITMPQETQTAALLNLFMYLDYEGEVNNLAFGQTLERARYRLEHSENGMTESQRNTLLILENAMQTNPEIQNMRVTIPSHDNYDGMRGAVFTNGNDAYVVYRGTGDGKWIDNGEGMTSQRTESQQQAIDFFDEMAERFGWDESTNLTVTGHSKGGNNSQAATLGAEYGKYVDQCISFDGQGMSESAAQRYREELGPNYDIRTNKMYSVCGENDPVNELGYSMFREDHTAYIETNCSDGALLPTHALEYFFYHQDENGNYYFDSNMNGQSADGQGPIGRYADKLNAILMKMPEETRNDCAMALMQLIEFGEEYKTGYNGHHASLEEFLGFYKDGIPAIFYSIVMTEDGREALNAILGEIDWNEVLDEMYQFLELKLKESIEEDGWAATIAKIAALIMSVPLVVSIVPKAIQALNVVARVVDILQRLEALTEEIAQLLRECWETVQEFAESVHNWIKEHVKGQIVVREADFRVNIYSMVQAAMQMQRVQRIYQRAVYEMDAVRGSLPVGGLSGWALRGRISRLEGQVGREAGRIGRMENAITGCSEKYQVYESRITDSVLALA